MPKTRKPRTALSALDVQATLGARIRARRDALGLSQPEVAERVGTTVPHLSKLENGHTNPSLYFLYRLSIGLDSSVDDLLPDFQALEDAPTDE